MELSQDLPEGYFYIRSCGATEILVIDRPLRRSFAMAPDRILEDWPVHDVAELDAAASEALLVLDPEVVLLGTGARQHFPPQAKLLPLLRRRIGVEVMDNAAAARTYNLLAADGRRVVVAMMLPGGTPVPPAKD